MKSDWYDQVNMYFSITVHATNPSDVLTIYIFYLKFKSTVILK